LLYSFGGKETQPDDQYTNLTKQKLKPKPQTGIEHRAEKLETIFTY
jgi:hypothetical protein